ncbi:MAG: retroviral-like aspartic protease family protein [Deltaproteobacteria bacterium]|nr:retroviral-like aspartic protease family protein [Deltaproteobacteria bacterium]
MSRASPQWLPMASLATAFASVACAPTTLRVTPDGDTVAVLAEAGRARQPKEPRVSANGSDLSDLPQLYPDGDWLPIEAPLLSMAVVAPVTVNGEKAIATLDTGAMGTTMSVPVAEALGVFASGRRGRRVTATDAHGQQLSGEKVALGEVGIGRHRWNDVEVTVLGDQPDLFLVGADVLRDLDLLLAADEGLVGIFSAGRGPVESTDRVIALNASDRQLIATGSAANVAGKEVSFPLIVDTGAWNTSVPLLTGINGGLAADTSFEAVTVAVGGEQTNRGRFVLDPLKLGGVPVGRVLAIGSTMRSGPGEPSGGLGLLGNDVLMRHHALVSFQRAEIRVRPPVARSAERTRGPGGARCTADGQAAPCISVALVAKTDDSYEASDLSGVCLKVDVDPVFAGKTLELAITGQAPDLMNGGAIRAFLTANDEGAHACFHVWRQLENLGIGAGTPLALRWVRTEGVRWPCDPMKTRCVTFTGPLAKPQTK